jgi:predicted transcriptional regulator
MSTATQRETPDLSVPGSIDSPRAKLVHLYLDAVSGATVDEIQSALGLKRISLYSVLGTLEDRELVEQNGDSYVVA